MDNGGDATSQGFQQVSVAVRIRPPLRSEVGHDHCVRVLGRKVICKVSPPSGLTSGARTQRQRRVECGFEQVLDMMSTQEDLWQVARPAVDKVLEGYNATIFTYGMTGSGKTYTMLGPEMMALAQEGQAIPGSADARRSLPNAGVLPRSIDRLFAAVESEIRGEAATASLCVSYLQLYRERCYDLLVPAGCAQPLRVREDSSEAGVCVEGLSSACVTTKEACLGKLLFGCSNIAYRTTASNEQSSRSHVVLTLTLRRRSPSGQVRQSKLHLVDLAGNERWNTFGPQMSNLHVKELTCINQSLHALGNCIQALSKPGGQQHVPYRSSALTMLLRESLSGNSLILLLCTICGCSLYQMQTLCTLRFADRAKRVKLQAHVNQVYDKRTLLEQSQAEVEYLRSLVAEAALGLPMQEKVEKLQGENTRLAGENSELKRQVASLSASQKLAVDLSDRYPSGLEVTGRGLANRAQTLRGRCCSEPALPVQEDWLCEDSVCDGSKAKAEPACPRAASSRPTVMMPRQNHPFMQAELPRSHLQEIEQATSSRSAPDDATAAFEVTAIRAHGSPKRQTSKMGWQEPDSPTPKGPSLLLQARHPRREPPSCPMGHQLECLGPSSNPSGEAAYIEWHCDNKTCRSNCSRTPHLERYHCSVCKYDLCECCIHTALHAQDGARISPLPGMLTEPLPRSARFPTSRHAAAALQQVQRRVRPSSTRKQVVASRSDLGVPQESLSQQQEMLIQYYKQKFYPAMNEAVGMPTTSSREQHAAVKSACGACDATPAGSDFSTTAASTPSVWSRAFRMPASSKDVLPAEDVRLPQMPQAPPGRSPREGRHGVLRVTTLTGLERERQLPEVPSRGGKPDHPLRPPHAVQTGHAIRRDGL